MIKVKSKIFYILVLVMLLVAPVYADNFQNGVAALKQKDYSQALTYFSRSVAENKTDPARIYFLGLTLKNMGQRERAQRAFETALKLKPSQKLTNNIKNQMKQLSSGNAPMQANLAPKVRKIQQRFKGDNYLSHVVANQQICRWDLNKMPLKVYIDNGKGINAYNPEFRSKVIKALNVWQSALRNKIRFVTVANQDDADVQVAWLQQFKGHKIGENPFTQIKGVIVRSDVNLSTVMPDGRPKTPDELYSVVLHEFGHVLGIQGHSPNRDDVMYFSLNNDNYNGQLTERDKNTIRMIYQLEADVSNNLPLDMASTKEFYKFQLMAEKGFISKDFKTALTYYLKANQLYGKDPTLNFNIAICYLNLKDYANAFTYLDRAEQLNPDDTLVKYNIAVAKINYVTTLSPEEKRMAPTYYQEALDSLETIENKSDKPANTDDLIQQLRSSLNQ